GCLPNHIVGRGIVKRLRELYPSAQILSLDYDPDVSFANVENRLQMLVMNVREMRGEPYVPIDLAQVNETVVAVAEEAGEIAEEVLEASSAIHDESQITPEHIELAERAMREMLEREDLLAARAKDALIAARRLAQQGANDAANVVIERALAASELAREMRTRTKTSIAALAETAEQLSEQGNEAFVHVQKELTLRAAEARAFAVRVREQVEDFLDF
ncbi:MAG: hypothetical protein IJG88_02275, partial [Eggerthellaceae bacterium]|nr:hypothetical protein [Eggerthellaceae bacterium]